MSIIDDALRETQDNLNQKGQEHSPDGKDVSQLYQKLNKQKEDEKSPPTKKEKTPNKSKSPLVGWLIFAILAAGLYYGYLYYSTPEKKRFDFKKLKISMPQPKQATPAPAKPKEYKEGEIVLNGVFTTDNRTAALINDKIYEVGDEISGKKVISISIDQVELMDTNGSITKLKPNK